MERLAASFKITILFASFSTMAQNRGKMMPLPLVKTNNGISGECKAADIYHLLGGMFLSFVLV